MSSGVSECVCIGLGSNLNHPETQLRRALAALDGMPRSQKYGQSSLYRSRAFGPGKQPDYVNAVALLRSTLAPDELLSNLQMLEYQFGRRRCDGERWAPRILDLDILIYGQKCHDSARLSIPHPQLARREFVLYPLLEIVPDLYVPGLGSVRELAAHCPRRGLRRIESVLQ